MQFYPDERTIMRIGKERIERQISICRSAYDKYEAMGDYASRYRYYEQLCDLRRAQRKFYETRPSHFDYTFRQAIASDRNMILSIFAAV